MSYQQDRQQGIDGHTSFYHHTSIQLKAEECHEVKLHPVQQDGRSFLGIPTAYTVTMTANIVTTSTQDASGDVTVHW